GEDEVDRGLPVAGTLLREALSDWLNRKLSPLLPRLGNSCEQRACEQRSVKSIGALSVISFRLGAPAGQFHLMKKALYYINRKKLLVWATIALVIGLVLFWRGILKYDCPSGAKSLAVS